jgi:hypothetical protein
MKITEDNSARTVLVTLALLAAILGGLWFFGRDRSEQTTFRQTLHMTQLAQQLGTALHVAAQSEKQAVMAETDDESRRYAQEARSATDKVAALLGELKQLSLHAPQETELVARFEASFAEYLKVDEEVLGLAVQNTNLKAFALSFGKAAAALDEMESALRPQLDGASDKAARQAQRALSEALRIKSLHAAHIMEKTDPRMDALEKQMAAADKTVRFALATLGKDGASALAIYERYWKLNGEIVSLSRQNTNVRSFTLSLERKTKVLAACDEALRALEEKIRTRMVTR